MKTGDQKRLYGDLAWVWPVISPVEDYLEETEFFVKVITQKAGIEVKTLLHLGCAAGTTTIFSRGVSG